MEVVILPFTTPKRLFVVLRPWSIAFYKDAGDFTRKPYKIIANCMLDTIPLVRSREGAAPSGSGDEGAEEGLGGSCLYLDLSLPNLFCTHRLLYSAGSQRQVLLYPSPQGWQPDTHRAHYCRLQHVPTVSTGDYLPSGSRNTSRTESFIY